MSGFRERVRRAVGDTKLHSALRLATGQLRVRRAGALEGLEGAEAARATVRGARLGVLRELPALLERFEERVLANGVHVHWATDAEAARRTVLEIAREHEVHTAVKAKSMVTEEIHLNAALLEAGIEVLETDLGEYVVQLAGDRPSHIILPIIHMSRSDVGRVFERRLKVPFSDDPAELASHARRVLREHFLAADMGISGANFGVVESGSLCLVSNEGNIRMVTSLPRVHVAILGIEKLLPTLADLERALSLLPRSATGQKLSAYTSLIQGPRRGAGDEGPEHLHVILLDGGRSGLLDSEQAEILACIRCGACLNVCPVYKAIGGHAYGDTYPGPMGSVLTPCLSGGERGGELPQASSLCGACQEACPVGIEIPRLLLSLRKEAVEARRAPRGLRLGMRLFAWLAARPRLYRLAGCIGGAVLRLRAHGGWIRKGPRALRGWTAARDFPAPERERFADWWARREEGGDG